MYVFTRMLAFGLPIVSGVDICSIVISSPAKLSESLSLVTSLVAVQFLFFTDTCAKSMRSANKNLLSSGPG